jgi:hypothetical protein
MASDPSKIIRSLRLLLALVVAQVVALPAFGLGWWGQTLEGASCVGKGEAGDVWDWNDVKDPQSRYWTEGTVWRMQDIHINKGLRHMETEPLDQFNFENAAAEFDFGLRAVPNWPDALKAVIDLDAKKRLHNRKTLYPLRSSYPPPECYLQRALVFRPKHMQSHLLFGVYLHQLRLFEKAAAEYLVAEKLDPDNAEVQYNLGLVYFELRDYEKASRYAQLAYSHGYPLPGLQIKLEKIGKWSTPDSRMTKPKGNDSPTASSSHP